MNPPSKKIIWAQIFLIFILPVFALYFNLVPLSLRVPILASLALVIYGIIHHEKWTHEDMGIRHDNFWQSLPKYILFVILGIIAIFLIDSQAHMPDNDTKSFFIRTFALFLPISFFQEFAFRSFLIPRLKMLFKNNWSVILVNTLLFTLIHIIYPNWGVGLPVAFVSGIFFAWLYIKYPNLLLIGIAHSILNVIAIITGFFQIPS